MATRISYYLNRLFGSTTLGSKKDRSGDLLIQIKFLQNLLKATVDLARSLGTNLAKKATRNFRYRKQE
jgi:hypothetical protein